MPETSRKGIKSMRKDETTSKEITISLRAVEAKWSEKISKHFRVSSFTEEGEMIWCFPMISDSSASCNARSQVKTEAFLWNKSEHWCGLRWWRQRRWDALIASHSCRVGTLVNSTPFSPCDEDFKFNFRNFAEVFPTCAHHQVILLTAVKTHFLRISSDSHRHLATLEPHPAEKKSKHIPTRYQNWSVDSHKQLFRLVSLNLKVYLLLQWPLWMGIIRCHMTSWFK